MARAFAHVGLSVARDRPFEGTIVPLEYLGKDERVDSVMIEVRRGLYCDEETGERNAEFDEVRAMLACAVMWALGVEPE